MSFALLQKYVFHYSDPGFSFHCILYSGLGSVDLFLYHYHFQPFLFVFKSWVVMGRFETGWLHFETKRWCPDFGLHARAEVLTLERALRCCLYARAGVLTLERVFPSPSTLLCSPSARADSLTLERVPSPAKLLEVCNWRLSGSFYDRAWVCVWRSSGDFHARAGSRLHKSETRLSGSFFISLLILKP